MKRPSTTWPRRIRSFALPVLLLAFAAPSHAQADDQRARLPQSPGIILGDTSVFPQLRKRLDSTKKALVRHPGSAIGWVLLGSDYFDLTEYGNAELALNNAIDLDSASAQAWYQRGAARERQGQFSAAHDDFSKAIVLKPDFDYAFLDRDILYQNLGLPRRSLDDLNTALRLHPGWAPALLSIGTAWSDMKQDDSAMAYYQRAIDADPGMYKAWNNLGDEHRKARRYADAIRCFDRALAIWPGYTFAITNRAQARYESGDKTGACADLRRAIELGRTDKQALYEEVCR